MNTLDTRTVLSNALLEIRRLRERVDELEAAQKEPIAIVGMGCRLPGGVKNPESFWDALERGVDGISQPSADRWGLQDAQTTVQWAGLLDGVDQFDPLFFGVSPREAVTMDPQQRLFLQVAIEALESAGALLPQLEGSRTGVYVGLCNNDYTQLLLNDPAQIDTHAATGVLSCVLPGRLAYLLGLRGPNLVVDTGCSASLVAVHLAVRSLRGRETDLALAGAVNLVLSGSWNEIPSRLQAFAKDGHCKTFDANADGTVRGEGCGVVVLKRLADAVRDGDPIRAVIRGTAVNQDGRSTSLTSPNVLSQQAVIREALADANVSPERVGYVETHGTGTALGDPIEFEALNATYGVARQSGQLCALGALKTNIGHLEAAAGIAGLIKAVCCLEHGQIPQNLHFRSLNPRMSLAGTPFVLPSEKGGLQWGGPEPRVAGVSSFGIGGTNAHVIVEQAPRTEPKPETGAGHVLLLMSAKTETSLGQLAQQWETLLADTSKPPSALAAASARCRTHYAWRLAISGSSVEQLREALRAAMDSDRIVRPAVEQPKVAFVFQGLGGQWANMARRLVEQEPVFRQTMQQCDEAVRSNVGWSVLDKLSDVDSLSEHSFVQPILFSIQASLAALLDSWGIRPQAVVGHSAGEIAAAYVAGALSLEDAVEVVCRRSELHSLLGEGGMALVALSAPDVRSDLEPYLPDVVIAACNGPATTIVSGAMSGLQALVEKWESRGVFCRLVKSLGAGHSPQVDPLRDELVKRLAVSPRDSRIPFYSTVEARVVDGRELGTAYWGRNMREPVLFAPAIEQIITDGVEIFVELGPHSVLGPAIADTLRNQSRQGLVVPTMRRDTDERQTLLAAVGELYCGGVELDYEALFASELHPEWLPTYAWDNDRYWLQRRKRVSSIVGSRSGHPLLGPSTPLAVEGSPRVFEVVLDTQRMPFLQDHRVGGMIVFPGAGYVELAWSAAQSALGEIRALLDVRFERLLVLREEEVRQLQVVLRDNEQGDTEVSVSSILEAGAFERHFRARVERGRSAPRSWTSETAWECSYDTQSYYAALGKIGLSFGPSFTGIVSVHGSRSESVARLTVPEAIAESVHRYAAHPALLDIFFQTMGHFLIDGPEFTGGDIMFPTSVRRIVLHQRLKGPDATAHARLVNRSSSGVEADLCVLNGGGDSVVEVEGFTISRIGRESLNDEMRRWTTGVHWQPYEAGGESELRRGRWVIWEGDEALAAGLSTQLQQLGNFVSRIPLAQLDASADTHRTVLSDAIDEDTVAVVFAPAFDIDAVEEGPRLCTRLARLVALASAREPNQSLRLFVLTRGVAAIGDPRLPVSMTGALLQGMMRTVGYEHAALLPTTVDLGADGPLPQHLGSWLARLGKETCVAARGSERWVARLRPVELTLARTEVQLAASGSYLVVGGLGGIGLELASYLVRRGAGTVVLASRSEPSSTVRSRLADLKASGARVVVERLDVSDEQQVSKLLDAFASEYAPLKGIFHLAVVLDDGAVVQLSEERFARVFAPKVRGAHHLHVHSQRFALEHFVMFSSASSIIGSPGQGSYSAANAYLDALAQHRVGLGLPALSINLGVFEAAAGQSDRLRERGAQILDADFALSSVGRLMNVPRLGTVGLFSFEMERWAQFYPFVGSTPYFGVTEDKGRAEARDALRQQILEAEGSRRIELIERHLRKEVGRVLRLAPGRFEANQPWASYGIDSLMGLEIRNRLEATLGVALPAVIMYAEPNLGSLVKRIAKQFDGPTEPKGPVTMTSASQGVSIEQMSEREADGELARRLAALRAGGVL